MPGTTDARRPDRGGAGGAAADGRAGAGALLPRRREQMLREVLEGLSRPQKELSPKYFYDRRGSELFEEITRLPEYYLTRTERTLLERWIPPWVDRLRPATLVELGAGSARKTRVLLDAMEAVGSGRVFVPVDVSRDFLDQTARQLRSEYPSLRVLPQVADMTRPLELPERLPRPALLALLGSTIGNFAPRNAGRLLARVRATMQPRDRFLLGADLRPGRRKPLRVLEAAYNDARGITAAFNLNVLEVLNRELDADFEPDGFLHRAFYDDQQHRIEMHLVSRRPQRIRIAEDVVAFREGETVRTEISCKYDRDALQGLFTDAGLRLDDWAEDEDGYYALALGAPAP